MKIRERSGTKSVRTIIAMSNDLKVWVNIEGIEATEQLQKPLPLHYDNQVLH